MLGMRDVMIKQCDSIYTIIPSRTPFIDEWPTIITFPLSRTIVTFPVNGTLDQVAACSYWKTNSLMY